MPKNKIPNNFSIELFDVEKVSDTLSKARASIFHRGANRNGGYISEEFAEQLLSTLPYTPVKGIYIEDKQDFSNHGKERTEGRIYGVVAEDPNISWKEHLDKDGVTRTYATADVYLFTALYDEAMDIVGKGQSMELYPPSITGEWITVNGSTFYKYTSASFLGLQVLGDDVEPAFRGASFFSLEDVESQRWFTLFMNLSEKVDQLTTGRIEMPKKYNPNFALSDRVKENKLFEALNPEEIRYWIIDTYSDHVVAFDLEEDKIVKVNYSKDEVAETVTIGEERVEVFAEYITEGEKTALSALRTISGVSTFEEIEVKFNENIENISNMETSLSDKDAEILTLSTEKETAETTVTELKEELATYVEFKDKVELEEKQAVIAKYAVKLPKETLESYEAKLAEYNLLDLAKDLAYELVQSDLTIFSAGEPGDGSGFVPKPTEGAGGVEALLDKYKK